MIDFKDMPRSKFLCKDCGCEFNTENVEKKSLFGKNLCPFCESQNIVIKFVSSAISANNDYTQGSFDTIYVIEKYLSEKLSDEEFDKVNYLIHQCVREKNLIRETKAFSMAWKDGKALIHVMPFEPEEGKSLTDDEVIQKYVDMGLL